MMRRDELKQPLQRRGLFERLWQRRPSALAAAYAVMLTSYAASGAWLIHQKHPFAGEPMVSTQLAALEVVHAAPQVLAEGEMPNASGRPKSGAADGADLETASTDQATPMPEPPRQKLTKLDSHVTIVTNSRPTLVKAPVEAITENSPQGPLPKIASNGKKPSDIYAKPVSLNTIHSDSPKIVLIIGGMGLNEKLTRKAISDLPADVTFAFAPYGTNLQAQVDKARDDGHEVFLQLPMEPIGFPANSPGPKTLLAEGDPATNGENLNWHLSRFTGYAGVINYMGGKFLGSPNAVKSLLFEIKKRGLAFVEDGTLPAATTDQAAGAMNLPVRHGISVIDQNPDAASIASALNELEQRARNGETVIGTGSGLDVTIDTVRDWARDAQSRGVELLPATAAFKGRMG